MVITCRQVQCGLPPRLGFAFYYNPGASSRLSSSCSHLDVLWAHDARDDVGVFPLAIIGDSFEAPGAVEQDSRERKVRRKPVIILRMDTLEVILRLFKALQYPKTDATSAHRRHFWRWVGIFRVGQLLCAIFGTTPRWDLLSVGKSIVGSPGSGGALNSIEQRQDSKEMATHRQPPRQSTQSMSGALFAHFDELQSHPC